VISDEAFEQWRNQYQSGCVFCAPNPQLMVSSGVNFGVCFDIAPLTPGHLILHSAEHHACAGELPAHHLAELIEIKQALAQMLRDTYGAVTFYEHGRAGHCLTDGPEHRLCHHFHLHAVPVEVDISGPLAQRFDRIDATGVDQLPELYEQYGDYLYVESGDGKGSYFVVDRPIERHLLRTMISEAIGEPQRADWKSYATAAPLVEGMARLSGQVRP
jgi:diadenosine tetraphosphate (Ap4A) HIT family hydrolase